ncbi:hypothetical protein KW783_01155 [Candidatus Parcubacteria bacterium]|nr:hypothetical protein [Candidatus Parcubacteria bacterium]
MNQKRYWLRGGIITLSIGLGLLLLSYSGALLQGNQNDNDFLIIPGLPAYIVLDVMLTRSCFSSNLGPFGGVPNYCFGMQSVYYQTLIVLFSWVIIAVFIGMPLGWLYGKFKNKNKNVYS